MDIPYLLQHSQSQPASGAATKPASQGISLLEFQPAVMCYLNFFARNTLEASYKTWLSPGAAPQEAMEHPELDLVNFWLKAAVLDV